MSAVCTAHDSRLSSDRPASDARRARSRVTNSAGHVAGIDGRSPLGRRIRDLFKAFRSRLDAAAVDDVTAAKIKTAAETRAIAEEARAMFLRGETVSLEDIVRLENQAARAERALGLGSVNGNSSADTGSPVAGSQILEILRRRREEGQ